MIFAAALLISSMLGQTDLYMEDRHPVPWFLPRYAAFQTYFPSGGGVFQGGAIVPALRLGWEIGAIEQPRNHFVVVAELGPSFAASLPPSCTRFYEHFALLGVGYRGFLKNSSFYWGISFYGGPGIYGGAYLDQSIPNDAQWTSYMEGRVNIGWKVLSYMRLSLAAGYGSPFQTPPRYPNSTLIGGFFVGVMGNWR